MTIMTNKNGDIFLEYDRVEESKLSHFQPLTHALIVVKYNHEYLLAWNQYRQNWEIAGGKIDPGETPRQCAIRELMEETGQVAEQVRFCGVMKFQLQPDQRIEYGALYTCELSEIRTFRANHEIAKIIWWDQTADIGYINEIDAKCIELI